MFCPKCGTQNPDTGKFCRSCGTNLAPVSEALTGTSGEGPARSGRTRSEARLSLGAEGEKQPTIESAVGKFVMGVAFVIVSIALAFSGQNWWFWMLIPAFAMIGSGVGQFIQLKSTAAPPTTQPVPQDMQHAINSVPTNAALPPTQTEYVPPARPSIYDTGEFAPPPASVTEETTRHLEVNNEGETMTLPKK